MNQRNSAPVILPQSGLPEGTSETCNKGSLRDEREAEEETEELNYDPIPPKRTVMVSVRYRIRGRGQPLPYPLDVGDGQ
ncbi:MAG: hypothetical protein ACYC3I_11705 [Gemmataceae bacterium]